jgi:ferrochelatase
MSSYETAVERVRTVLNRRAPHLRLTVQPPYYAREDYVEALVASAQEHLRVPYDHLLFSFHGVPERHLRKSDPTGCHCLQREDCCRRESPAQATCYRAQCLHTVDAFVRKSGVTRYSVAFQSRLGRDPWLTPYTDKEIERLAREGVRRLRVLCPAFGTDFSLIPCLNRHPAWIGTLSNMVAEFALPDSGRRRPAEPHTAAAKTS